MRNLDFTSDSPQSIKLGDSNDVLSLQVTESDKPVDLSKVSSITVKIGNTLGFLTEINVDVSSLLHPTDGIIDVVISSKFSSKLPAGQYLLEVWIDDAQGNTVIYPDTSYPTVIGFSIKKNIMTETSTVISTLTLADFKTKFDEMQEDLQYKAASGYFKGLKGEKGDKGDVGATGPQGLKGDKGDTGTVDNAGLINSQAFQSLQTQVNNSAVGTNLLVGTSNILTTVAESTGWGTGLPKYHSAEALKANQTYTASCYSEPAEHDATICMNVAGYNVFGTTIAAGSKGISTLTITLTPADAKVAGDAWIVFTNEQKDNSTVSYKEFKLEKGIKATPWCPNPSETLTQSDYAKIKAAIVALGGALS